MWRCCRFHQTIQCIRSFGWRGRHLRFCNGLQKTIRSRPSVCQHNQMMMQHAAEGLVTKIDTSCKTNPMWRWNHGRCWSRYRCSHRCSHLHRRFCMSWIYNLQIEKTNNSIQKMIPQKLREERAQKNRIKGGKCNLIQIWIHVTLHQLNRFQSFMLRWWWVAIDISINRTNVYFWNVVWRSEKSDMPSLAQFRS